LDSLTLKDLYNWFNDYVKSFYTEDQEIQALILKKEQHSLMVTQHCQELARWLELDEEMIRLAEAMGLCHDVGRFKQVTLYRTFKDALSVNHGHLGVEEMKAAGVPGKLHPDEWRALAFAVSCHNAVAIPGQPDEKLELFAKIIRDTDKLDIYRVVPPQPPVGRCSPKLLTDMLAGKLLSYEDVKTPEDFKLIRVSWIYDIYYPWTLHKIMEARYIERLFAALPAEPLMPQIRKQTEDYIADKLGGQFKS
jgi:putative nucleotidyltransferase with HDIG domain